MKLLPFIIIILSSAFILKTSNFIERFFTEPRIVTVNVSEEQKIETKKSSDIDNDSPDKEAKSDAQTLPTKSAASNSDVVKECLSQKEQYTETELQILDNLSNKKFELDKREETILEKEKLLEIAAEQVEVKLKSLKDQENSIKELLEEYIDKEDAKIDRLVKIYQNMKPEKAAKLFDIMDMDILIKVVNKMKETNSGAIISLMDSNKATELTSKMAHQKAFKANN